MRYLSILLLLAACATASTSTPSSAPYQIRDYYSATYLDKPNHKAFAVAAGPFIHQQGYASGSGWAYSNLQGAMKIAVVWCEKGRKKHGIVEECRFYAINDTVVWGMSDEDIQGVVDSY